MCSVDSTCYTLPVAVSHCVDDLSKGVHLGMLELPSAIAGQCV